MCGGGKGQDFFSCETTWAFQIETKIKIIMWSNLFKDRVLVEKVFLLPIHSFPKNKELKSSIDILTLDCSKTMFSISCYVDPSDFLKVAVFHDSISEMQHVCLQPTIHYMINAKCTCLTIFITRLKFFRGSQILVDC